MLACPCGSQLKYEQCCGPYLAQSMHANTPEKLMRSRYTAYAHGKFDYIAKTMLPPAKDAFDLATAQQFADKTKWLKLTVLTAKQEQDQGLVEYKAYFLEQDIVFELHEVSLFKYCDGHWFYYQAENHTVTKLAVGRNDACPCGLGKKFKKCCLAS